MRIQIKGGQTAARISFSKAWITTISGKLQEAVLELHRAKQQMAELEDQQRELQTTETRYAEVKAWLSAFEDHIKTGAIMDSNDGIIMKQLVEQIIVNDDGMEIRFKCGAVIEQKYTE